MSLRFSELKVHNVKAKKTLSNKLSKNQENIKKIFQYFVYCIFFKL